MGLKVIVIDIDSNAPGFIEADEYTISTRDLESISKFIKNYQKNNGKIDGVLLWEAIYHILWLESQIY